LSTLPIEVTGSSSSQRSSGLTREQVVGASLVFADLYEYLLELIDEREREPGDDYISIMVSMAREDGSSETPGRKMKRVWALIGAGFETTANQLANGFRTLLEHRDQWDLLLEDRSYVDNATPRWCRASTPDWRPDIRIQAMSYLHLERARVTVTS
jgi:hypothetical protein